MFKNLSLFRLPTPWGMTLEKLEEQLSRNLFARCPSNQPQSAGWTPPRGENMPLVHSVGGQWIIVLCTEERLLPASVIRDEVDERSKAMEAQQGYAPGRKQLRELKERVVEELMPRAFTRRHKTYAWIDPKAGWLIVDAPGGAKSDAVVENLRRSLDELPLALLHTEVSPQSAMADWLTSGDAPAGFTIDRDCELKAVGEEKAAVRYVRHPLEGAEVKAHLASGKLPTRIALTWDDRISFVLTEKLEIRSLAYLDLLKDSMDEQADDQFDADIALMTGELSRFLPDLISALGGEITE